MVWWSACLFCAPANAQIPGRNVNMVSGTQWPGGDPFLQRQNEPSVAVSTRNPQHLLAGANDYRTVDLPGLPSGQVTGDAWLGVFKTNDGGQTWFSFLLPGYPQDNSATGLSSPLKKYAAAADPVVRAGTNGLFFYSGIAFNRGANGAGAVFVSRFIDNNNQENGDPIAYVGTSVVQATDGQTFLDKPWIATDIPRTGAKMCTVLAPLPDGSEKAQSFPGGNVYVAYTQLAGSGTSQTSRILFVSSTNCGATWSAPLQVSRSTDRLNQGGVIAIDPRDGSVYVAWRRFASPAPPTGGTAQTDILLAAKSTNGGASFGPVSLARQMLPGQEVNIPGTILPVGQDEADTFDQGTSNVSFRTNAYPALAVDGAGNVYLAWSERGIGPGGDSRIMLTTGNSLLQFAHATPVDNPPTRGHQLMPVLSFSAGQLTVVYYDLREDSTDGVFTALGGGQYSETHVPVGDLAGPNPQPAKVFNSFIADTAPAGFTPIQRRHTMDVRAAQASPGPAPVFSPSAQVSDYLFGSRPGSATIEQLQFNPPNLPMFSQGTVPFDGDYIDIAAAPAFIPNPNGTWSYNTAPSPATVFHTVWTDNRDVRPPLDGDWTHYTPPSSPSVQGPSLFDPTKTVPSCVPGQEGMRNQNIYSARLTQGLLVGSPGNAKPLGNATLPDGRVVQIQRGFVVFAQNTRNAVATFRLTIVNQPPGGKASFLQFPVAGQPDPLTQLDVEIPPLSGVARTVFINAPDPKAIVQVTVQEINGVGGTLIPGGLQSSVLLNPDITNPSISNPSISNPSISNPSISNAEVFNPSISNPSISNPNISNPSISNPSISNTSISNVSVANPDLANPNISNVDVLNLSISNPDLGNPSISNPSISNAAMQDTTWTVSNDGNTAGSFNVDLLVQQAIPSGIVTQLVVHRIYAAPVAQACALKQTTQTVLLANVTTPTFTVSGPQKPRSPVQAILNPSMGSPSVPLAPGETIQVTVRVVDPNPPAPGVVSFQPAAAVKPTITSQAVNTVNAVNGVTQPPVAGGPMSVTTTFLLNAVLGANYQAVLQANGGYGARTWSVVGGGLPPGLTLKPDSGVISGMALSLGLFTFNVQVQDSATPVDSATQTLSLLVVSPLAMATSALPAGQAGQAYSAPVAVTGGFGTITWSVQSGMLPPGLMINSSTGLISGLATTAGTFPFTIAAQDSNAPPQVVTGNFTIVVQPSSAPTLSFVQQPTTTANGMAVSPAVSVLAKNSLGVAVSGANLKLTLQTNPSGATLIGGVGTTNVSGIATFPGLRVNKVGTGYTLAASGPGFTGATSNAFNITPVGLNLSFATQPGLSTAGQPITPVVQIHAQDNAGNALGGVNVTITLGTNPCSGALTGTTMAATGPTGNAAFPNLAETAGGAGYTLVASAMGATPATSNPFTVIGFCPTGSMPTPRLGGTITLLNSGRALLAGGFDGSFTRVASATLYDPPSGSFLATGNMNVAREGATATLLSNGKVLIAGGFDQNNVPTATAELYDPGTGTFTLTGSMAASHADATATLLPSGKVLITSGSTVQFQMLTPTAEIYDPASGTFTATGSMNEQREGATATLLPNGTVLIAGGFDIISFSPVRLASAEIYDPSLGTFSATGPMNTSRVSHTATLLPNGKVLLAGGGAPPMTTSAELYDPAAGSFSLTGNMLAQRANHTATLLPNGKVLLAGGSTGVFAINNSTAELFDPVAVSFSLTGSPVVARSQHLAVALGTGNVLLAGGADTSANVLSSAELYLAFAAPPLKISTLALTAGNLGQAYSASLNTNGGTGAVTWSKSAGVLPPGLMLSSSGTISGTPTAMGTFTFTAQATDSGTPAQIAYQPLTIQILNTSAKLSFVAQPPTAVAGQVMVPPPQVKVQNASGPIVGQTVTLALGNNPSGASLAGAIAVSGVGGLATFDMLSVSTFGTGYTLVASAPSFAGATSSAFNVLPAGATLTFLVQPSNAVAGQAITPSVQVRAADMTGAALAGVSVTLQFVSNPGAATLAGGSAVTNLSGIATFPALSVSSPGAGYSLAATAPNFTGGTSNAFNVFSGTPAISFLVQPSNVVAGQPISPDPQVLVQDGFGGPLAGVSVTGTLAVSPCPGLAGGPGTVAVTNANGIAVFTNVVIGQGGIGFVAMASAPGVMPATSIPFNVIGPCTSATLTTPREAHEGVLLPNGKVLLAGGDDGVNILASAELYDPAANTFTATGSMTVQREDHRAILLPTGKVLIVAGFDNNFNVLNSAELYDPAAGTFTATGSMSIERDFPTATLLANGKVLIIGGADNFGNLLTSAEIYDPATGMFTLTGSLTVGHWVGHATLLQSGKVLVTGGSTTIGTATTITNAAELYDPVSATFSPTGGMIQARRNHRTTTLANGQVLVTGGRDATGGTFASAELYDPVAGTFSATGSMAVARRAHEQVLLRNGEVLVTGGVGVNSVTPRLESFNPPGNDFRPDGNLMTERVVHTATLLNNGKVLVAGGSNNLGNVLNTSELVSVSPAISTLALPDGTTVQPYSLALQALGGTGALTWNLNSGALPNGLNLSSGGVVSGKPGAPGIFTFTVMVTDSGSPALTDTKILSIRIWSVAATTSLTFAVQPSNTENGLTVIPSVAVLAQNPGGPASGVTVTLTLGGNPGGGMLTNASAVTGANGIAVFPALSITGVSSGYTLIASAAGFAGAVSNPFTVVPVTPFLSFVAQPGNTPQVSLQPFNPPVQVLAVDRNGTPINGLDVGMTLVTDPCVPGGFPFNSTVTGANGIATLDFGAFIRDGGAGYVFDVTAPGAAPLASAPFNVAGFCRSGPLVSGRYISSSTLLLNGKVLITGGAASTVFNPPAINTAEIYDPVAGTSSATANMNVARWAHTSTLLPNGLVLIAGGADGNAVLNTAELYDPVAGTFTPTGNLVNGRSYHTATLLPNGKVLITGGFGGGTSAELYDPASGTFTLTGSMSTARGQHTATLLANGKVLITGGTDGVNVFSTAELYDPVAGTFTLTGSMTSARVFHTATLLANGKVLITGGRLTPLGGGLNTAEIYDPVSGTFAATGNMTFSRSAHAALLLANGKVLVVGGPRIAEAYDPLAGTFSIAGRMAFNHGGAFVANLLSTGDVLVAGGATGLGVTVAAEIYHAFAGIPLKVSTMALADGNVGQPYSTTLQAIGGSGGLTWSVVMGALPAGLMLSSAGVISGTPTTPGPNGFTVKVSDSSTPPMTAMQPLFLTVNNTPGASLSFTVQPTSTVAGMIISPAVQVLVQNSGGPVVGQMVTLALGNNPGGATLFGPSAVSGAGGIATFSGLSLNAAGFGYTLVATASGFTGATSSPFDVAPVGANLSFLVQPSNTVAGLAIAPAVEVRAADGAGNGVAGLSITLGIGTNPGSGTLSNASAVTNLAGIATFPSLSVSNAGNGYTLTASKFNFAGATSNSFNVLTTGTTMVTFVPANIHNTAGQPASPAPQVLVTNTTQGPLPGVTATVSLIASPCPGATVQGTLTAITNASGIATFTNVTVSNGGWGYKGQASAAGATTPVNDLLGAQNSQFNVAGYCNSGSMGTPRRYHTATLLPNGLVLVTGGDPNTITNGTTSAELYNPLTRTFSPTGSMNVARAAHTATLLPNGKVLIAGGRGTGGLPTAAELYDPASGAFSLTGSMSVGRQNHAATLLPNGKVLITGGYPGSLPFPSGTTSAEVYDPATGTFASAGNMTVARTHHAAVLTPNGKVLIVGGQSDPNTYLNSAETYDPATNTFTVSGSMSTARRGLTATILPNGNVLVAGGLNSTGTVNSAEIFNPVGGSFSATGSMNSFRQFQSAVLLPSGLVLLSQGFAPTAELYNLVTGTFTPTGSPATSRGGDAAVLLPDGSVLDVGGVDNNSLAIVASSEVFFPDQPPFDQSFFFPTGTTANARQGQTATVLPNGLTLVAGGINSVTGSTAFSSAELYNLVSGTFSLSGGTMSAPRIFHSATLLPSGKVLVAGGRDVNFNPTASADLYDPSTDTFTPTGSLNLARRAHTATLLPNGKVLIAGGAFQPQPGSASTNTAEIYDPASGLFILTGNMTVPRGGHTATLLPSGKVLIAGGVSGPNVSASATAELYDPATGMFTPTGSMTTGRSFATATLLPNGKVLVANGASDSTANPSFLTSAEIYDPAAAAFTPTGSSATGRAWASAVLLPNGKAFVAGGENTATTAASSAEVYDPASGVFSPARNMQVPRVQFTATLLPNGTVLTVGGSGDTTADLFAPGPSSRLPAYLCSLESSLHSIVGNQTAAILFQNTSGSTRNVYWLNYSGTRQLFNTLSPGQSYVQSTFLTHPWVTTDSSNTCQAIFLPTLESGVAVIP